MLLAITDGDPPYLRFDAKKAMAEVVNFGVNTYCMNLDPRADQYVSRILGARNYMAVDHVERLFPGCWTRPGAQGF